MSKQLPEGLPTLLEILADGGVWQLVCSVVVVAETLFGIWIGVHAALVACINAIATGWAKLFARSKLSRLVLRYLLRDRFRSHILGQTAQMVATAAQPVRTPSAAAQTEPSDTALHQSPARQQKMALAAP